MRKIGIGLLSASMIASWTQLSPLSAQETGLTGLNQAYHSMLAQVKAVSMKVQADSKENHRVTPPRCLACDQHRSANAREFNLEYGGIGGPFWRLIPNPNPPGSGLMIDVDQGDHVRMNLSNWADTNWTTFEINQLDALVDGKLAHGIYLYFGSFDAEQHIVEFDAAKPGIYPIYALDSGRVGPIGQLIIHEKKAKN